MGVVGSERCVDFAPIAAIRPGRVVSEGGPHRFELMENLRRCDHEAVSREPRRCPTDRPCHLKDLGEQDDAWITSPGRWSENVCAHRAAWSLEVSEFVIADGHGFGRGAARG